MRPEDIIQREKEKSESRREEALRKIEETPDLTDEEKKLVLGTILSPEDLNELEEQQLRDKYGYTKSESRTQRERQQAADKMLAKFGAKSMTDEELIAQRREAARVAGEEIAKRFPDAVNDIPGRMDRAEKYARWELAGKP